MQHGHSYYEVVSCPKRVRHAYHVYFKEFVMCSRVVSISMLLYPCNIDCDPPVLHQFGIRASGSNLLQYFLFHFYLHHPESAMTHHCCCHGHHFGPIEMFRERSPHSTGLSFSHPGGIDEDITSSQMTLSQFIFFEFICFFTEIQSHISCDREVHFVRAYMKRLNLMNKMDNE